MTEREAYIAFNLLPDVGAVRVARLVSEYGSAVAAWEALPDKLDWDGKPPRWEREIEHAAKAKVTLVTLLDDAYPALLREIPSPPLVLYVAGDPAALSKDGVALVGTRHPTLYGTDTAQKFAVGLAHAGWAIYSGLAVGIDAAAHRGALLAHGVTAGILGGALDKFYPKDNTRLAREIVDAGGAVASEFPFGRAPDQQTFPQRNHVVAALARGVLAVEAPLKSGTLITASLAADMGRVVMALPGRVDSRSSAGCLALLRDGARLVRTASDVEEELSDLLPAAGRTPAPPKPRRAPAPVPSFSSEEALVMKEVDAEGVAMDELIRRTGLSAARVNALCMELRLKGRVRFFPGNRVALPRGA